MQSGSNCGFAFTSLSIIENHCCRDVCFQIPHPCLAVPSFSGVTSIVALSRPWHNQVLNYKTNIWVCFLFISLCPWLKYICTETPVQNFIIHLILTKNWQDSYQYCAGLTHHQLSLTRANYGMMQEMTRRRHIVSCHLPHLKRDIGGQDSAGKLVNSRLCNMVEAKTVLALKKNSRL